MPLENYKRECSQRKYVSSTCPATVFRPVSPRQMKTIVWNCSCLTSYLIDNHVIFDLDSTVNEDSISWFHFIRNKTVETEQGLCFTYAAKICFISRAKLDAFIYGAESGKKVPHQICISCNYCGKPVSANLFSSGGRS